MSPSDRGEMLTKAVDMINTHKEIAIEGQTAVNILCTIITILKNIFCVCVCVHKYFKIIIPKFQCSFTSLKNQSS